MMDTSNLTALAQIQDFVVSAITKPVPVMDQPALVERSGAVTTGNERLSPAEQLDIYRQQFWIRHESALEEDFVSVARLLGDDAFTALCVSYIESCPPQSFTLRDLGDRLAEFVARTAPYRDDALLCDLCRVEWAFVEAFDAPDATPISAHKIAATPEDAWPGAKLTLHPALRLLALRYPAQDYRTAARTRPKHEAASSQPGMCATSMHAEGPLVRPGAQDTWLVVFRGADVLKFSDIEHDAFVLLSKLHAGIPLGRACEETVTELGLSEAAFQTAVGGWFSSWTQWGWVTDLVV